MIYSESNRQACIDALLLLRQDVGVPAVAEMGSDEPVEWYKCKKVFDGARREILAEHDWLFATEVRPLGEATECPAVQASAFFTGDKAFSYTLAADVVRVLDVLAPDGKRLAWKLMGRTIVTGKPNAHALVIKDIDDTATWPAETRNAFVYLLARELAIPIAGRDGDLKNWHQLYHGKLLSARVADLNSSGVGDPVEKDVIALICDEFTAESPKLPRSLRVYTERIREMRDPARLQILTAHRWNFAKARMPIDPGTSCDYVPGYPFTAPVPAGAIHVDCVRTQGGRAVEWRVEGRYVAAREPFSAIEYTRDVRDLSRWHPVLYRAFLFRLAADVARVVGSDPNDVKIMEEKSIAAISEAKLMDAREGNTPSDAWGRNYYADKMHGSRNPYDRRGCQTGNY